MKSSKHPLVAEFLVIVIGVLVALGVDTAWEARGDQARESLFLVQLRDELRVSAETLDAAVNSEVRVTAGADSLAKSINGLLEASEEDKRRWMNDITGPSIFHPATGTLQALLSSGDLRLVDDPRLRGAVLEYLNSAERFQGLYPNFQVVAVESYRHFGDQINLVTQIQSSVEPIDWVALGENPAVTSAIIASRISAAYRLMLLQQIQGAHSALLEALEGAAL